MKILMRMGMSPFDNCSLYKVVSQDTIGTNSGNMLFPYAIMRNIYSDGMIIDGYSNANPEDAEKINENYDMFIIPLANAFRDNFVNELRNLTGLIKKLHIPCIVVGVGLQANYEPDLNQKRSFDSDVVDFCSAVLEKSNSLGVRGDITASYLSKLGFEQHITVIGCPSMFMYGDFLPMSPPLKLSSNTRVAINYHEVDKRFFEFIERTKQCYPDYYYILQKIYELRLLYAGDQVPAEHFSNKYYVGTASSRSFIENRLRMFINVPSWIDFLSKMDISIGTCIHGGIAAILAGVPAIVFAADARVREIAEYHKIPTRKISEIDDSTTLDSLCNVIDFSDICKGHSDRYLSFQSFLKNNGIPYRNVGYLRNTDFDRKMDTITLCNPEGVSCYTSLSFEKQIKQLNNYLKICQGKIGWWKDKLKSGKVDSKNNLLQWEKSESCTLERLENLLR